MIIIPRKSLKNALLKLFFCWPSLVLANVFEILYPNEDLSVTYLNLIFGPLGNVGLYLTPNVLYFLIVKILIFPLLFASLMTSWIIFSGTLKSAQEGSFLGQKLAATSVIIRGTIGMALLTPDHTGYAAIQKLMMVIILSGVGLANTLWGMVTEQYAKGMSLMQPIVYDNADQAYAQKMIATAALVSYLQQTNYIISESLQADTQTASYEQLVVDPVTPYSCDPGSLNLFLYTNGKDPGIPSDLLQGSSNLLGSFIAQPYVQMLVQWMILNPTQVINVNNVFSQAGISPTDLNAWMINNYELTRQQMQIIDTDRSQDITPYMKQGWIVAGSIYWKLSTSAGGGSSYCDLLQAAGSTATPQGSTTDLQYWLTKLNPITFTNNPILSTSILNIQTQTAMYGTDEKNGQVRPENPIEGTVAGIQFSFNSLENTFANAMDKGIDPIIAFAQDCQRMMKSILVFFISTLLVIAAVSFIAVMRWQLPFVQTLCFTLCSILMLIMSFSFIFIPPSAMGGYYLPLIPLLIYSGAAIAWLIKVIEAIIAMPFVAVALLEPTQDEFGRAKAALVLTLHVMLKPALMVIGLFLGGRLATLAMSSLTLPLNAYFTFKSFALSSSNAVLERILIYILLNQVVVGIVVALATRSFSIIYKLPDQVFGWIGHRGHNSEVSTMVSDAHQGAEQGIQMMSQIFQIGTAVGKVAMEGLKQLK